MYRRCEFLLPARLLVEQNGAVSSGRVNVQLSAVNSNLARRRAALALSRDLNLRRSCTRVTPSPVFLTRDIGRNIVVVVVVVPFHARL